MARTEDRKQFTKEYKLDVIQQSYRCANIRQLANELGLRPGIIYKWRATYEAVKDSHEPIFPGHGVAALSPEQQEIAQLKRQLADARTERDILKKAIGIFGKNDG